MARRTARNDLLTEAELELMNLLWDHGGGTVRDLMQTLPSGRDVAYTTVSTIVRILERKGFVSATKEGRSHRYDPAIAREAYQERNLRHVVGGLFGGDPIALVRRLVQAQGMKQRDIQALRELLDGGEE